MPGAFGFERQLASTWVSDALGDREAIESAIGMPMGEMLGCGAWGCAFLGAGPWVIKLTRDPTEGPIWESLREWQHNTPTWKNAGLVRIREVLQLRPGVTVGGEEWPLYVAVREGVVPLFPSFGALSLTEEAAKVLGLRAGARLKGHGASSGRAGSTRRFVYETLRHLDLYRQAARHYYRAVFEEGTEAPDFDAAEPERHEMAEIFSHMAERGGWVGEHLAMTLLELLESNVVFVDLHARNVGLRVHERIEGERLPPGLVVFDPGHTPTPERPIRQQMRHNGSYC